MIAETFADLTRQFRRAWPRLAVTLAVGVVILLTIALSGMAADVALADLTRDPVAVAKLPFYVGILSNLGILFWSGSAGALTLAALVLGRRRGWTRPVYFFTYFALLTWLLVIDDLFLVHEEIYPALLPGSEEIVFAGYGGLLLVGLILFRRRLLAGEWLTLALALLFLGLSLVVDVLPDGLFPGEDFFEDGTKFLGILYWSLFFGRAAWRSLE